MGGDQVNRACSDLSIEPIREEHLRPCLDIYGFYVENSTATFHTHIPDMDEFREIVYLNKHRNKGFVITQNGRICGYVVLGRFSPREAYDDTGSLAIYLHPDCCGQGIGRIALRFIEQYAAEQGFHTLVATICGENQQSIRLFEGNGYTRCAHYKELGKKFGRILDIIALQKFIR